MSDMKIGIITFHRVFNYGAVLQCTSLALCLRQLGHDACVIDYNPPAMRSFMTKVKLRKAMDMPLRWWTSDVRRQIALVTDYARRSSVLDSVECRTTAELASRAQHYDAVFTGSDEVWNFDNARGWDPAYFLDFGTPVTAAKLSYAACSGGFLPDPQQATAMSAALAGYRTIMVRDRKTQEFVGRLGHEAAVVLDPVFIGDVPVGDGGPSRPYMVMTGGMTGEQRDAALAMAKRLGVKAVGLGYRYEGADENLVAIDPSDWVAWIKNSAWVVTTLFHAGAFALKFNRPFFLLDTPQKRGKFESLIAVTETVSQLVTPGNMPVAVPPDDLGEAMAQRLRERVAHSKDLLRAALA